MAENAMVGTGTEGAAGGQDKIPVSEMHIADATAGVAKDLLGEPNAQPTPTGQTEAQKAEAVEAQKAADAAKAAEAAKSTPTPEGQTPDVPDVLLEKKGTDKEDDDFD